MADPRRCATPLAIAWGLSALSFLPATSAAQEGTPHEVPPIHWGVVVDALGDLSTGGPTRPDSARFALRALEVGASARLSPRLALRATASVLEGGQVALDEGAGIAALGRGLELRAGRLLVPLGDAWRDHRHENDLIERPLAVRRFVAPELLAGSGVALSAGAGPVTLHAAAVDRFTDPPAGTRTIERANRLFSGLGFAARAELDAGRLASLVRGLELSAGGATSRVAQPLTASAPQGSIRVNAVLARQSVVTGGARWRGMAGRLELRGELLAQLNESLESVSGRIPADVVNGGPFYLGPTGTYTGGHGTARFAAWRALAVMARAESVQDPVLNGARRRVQGAGVEWGGSRALPAQLRAAWEHRDGGKDAAGGHRLLMEGVLTLGAHRPAGTRQ